MEASLGVLAGMSELPTYPINFIKVLMQIGHEPLAEFKSKDILGRNRVFLPNTFNYLKHVRLVDGFSGLYRGLGMKIISTTVGTMAYSKFSQMDDQSEDQLDLEMKENHTETMFDFFRKKTSKEINTKCWIIILSHPFHVMALRCMAQFVGGEQIYSSWNVFQNSMVIYEGEGVAGFFSGLIPRLIFEATTITVTNGLAYVLRKYLDEEDFDKYIDIFATFFAYTLTYPLSVVSTVSCISGSGLAAATPPKMPHYSSWLGVFRHLNETNGFRRGSSNVYRLYIQPVEYSADTVY